MTEYAKTQQEPLLLFFADAQKVFDQVAWTLMETEEMRLGKSMQQWIKIIYQMVIIASDGYTSERIEIGRGVKQ